MSWGSIWIRPTGHWCCASTRKAKSRHWTAHSRFSRCGGCIRSEITWSALRPAGRKFLIFNYSHPKAGSGMQRFDPDTLEPVGELVKVRSPWPAEVRSVRSKFPGMGVHQMAQWIRKPGEKPVVHFLRWETLPVNRDQPRAKVPPPSALEVIELVRE